MSAMGRELNMNLSIRMLVDASAALGVAQRQGIGKIRHLQTGALWIQEQELKKVLKMGKVSGTDNCSDILTKNVSREILERHASGMDMEYREGRAEKAVQLHLLQRKLRQARAEVKSLKSAKTIVTIDEPTNANNIEDIIGDADALLRKADEKGNDQLEIYITEWERKLCRQEGMMTKWLEERKISTQ